MLEEVQVEDIFSDWINSDAMDVASEWEGAVEQGAVAEEAEVNSFVDTALSSASAFKDWVVTKFKSMGISDMLMIGGGILMLYQLIAKQADQAQQSGNRIKLSTAIVGAQATLSAAYDNTVHQVAVDTKANTQKWNQLDPSIQGILEGEIAETGDIYWATIGPSVMETMATMPIYDPTP